MMLFEKISPLSLQQQLIVDIISLDLNLHSNCAYFPNKELGKEFIFFENTQNIHTLTITTFILTLICLY